MGDTFKKRKGTTNLGTKYEILNVANVVLNLVQDDNVKDFRLSSNDETFGDFDDIVVNIETKEGTKIYALQLKHKTNGVLNGNDLFKKGDDFDIQKYFTSFKSTQNKAQKFILYTNLKCKIEVDKPFQFQGEDFWIKLIKASLDDTFKITDRTDSCYKFEVVEDSPTGKSAEYKKFFNCFWLYTNQENVHQLEKTVSNKFQTVFAANEIESDLYLKFITNWGDEKRIKDKLNKEWMQHVIALIILSSRVKPLSFEPINDEVKIFQKAIDEFDITVFENDFCEKVVKLWGDANTKPYDTKELNQLRKKFQLFDRVISDINTVDINIASKLLWLMGACPLIVTGDESVYKAIELCPNKKFILLEKDSIKHLQSFSSVFRRLSDLDKESDIFLELIKTCNCSLQGKNKLSLENLIKENWKFLEAIKTDDLLEMIIGVCNLGGERESLSEAYVERYLVRNVIDLAYLDSFKQDTVVIVDCVEKMEILKNTQKKLICIDTLETNESDYKKDTNFNSIIYYSKEICSYSNFNTIRNKHENSKIHHFRFTQDDTLEWVRSKGDVNDLQKYKKDLLVEETKLFASRPKECINLIVADPGMGKSELMRSLKNNCSSDLWTVIFSPEDVRSLCNKIKAQINVVKIFDEFVCNSITDCNKLFFKTCFEQNKVLYIWDALDEITDNQLKTVVKIIEELSLKERVQWVTSRYHLKNFLESELSTVAFGLTQFDIETQKLYIENRLQIKDTKIIANIFEKIQSTFALVEHRNILGIPLQLFMLTELFLQDRQKYLRLLNEQFILTDLYFHFIKEKTKIFVKEKTGVQSETHGAKLLQCEAVNCLEKLALTLLFSTDILKSLNVSVEIDEQKKPHFLAIGLLTDFTNQIPRFIHNSFAEYLVAVFFSRNYHNFKNILKDILFESRFMNVRFFFDLLLAQNCPAHIAVLYKNIKLLTSYESEIRTSKDNGGRNALHLACAWGEIHPSLKVDMVDGSYVIDDNSTSNLTPERDINKLLVEYLLNICDVFDTDSLFDMKPLSYAQKSGNLLSEMKIMTKQCINFFTLDTQHAANMLYYSTLLGYDEVFDVFQTNNQESEARMKSYVNMKNNKNSTLLFVACVRGNEAMVQFLVANGSQVNLANKYGVTPLHVASLQGYNAIVEFLVMHESQVNLVDKQGVTPLYIASQNDHKAVVEFLVANGSKVNLPCVNGATPLHVASQEGYITIVKILVANGSKVNLADKHGATPLHMASKNGRKEVIEFLVTHGSEVNLANNDGITPLIAATQIGDEAIIKFLVANGSEVDLASKSGATPLYIASHDGHKVVVEFLVAHGSQVNLANKSGITPLHMASQNGHKAVVEFLVTHGSEVSLVNEDGVTPLHVASLNGHKAVIEFLVEHGAQVNLADKDGITPLYAAAQNGHKAVVEFLVEHGSKVNVANKNGITPLFMASESGHKAVIEFLVEHGSQVNIANKDGITPIHAASLNGHKAVIEFLVAHGSQVNHADKDGITPLYAASQNGHKAVVEFLVEYGSQVNLADKNGDTPLLIASHGGHKAVIEFLVAHKSLVNMANKDGMTPLYVATEIGDKAVIEFLVANGSDVNLTDKGGVTPLYIASVNGHKAVVEFLVAHGSQVNLGSKDGTIPLHVASLHGHDTIVKFLISNGSQVNIANKDGITPLYAASQNGHEAVIKLLVAHGSQVNCANKNGITPLHMASKDGHKAAVECLVSHGSQVNLANKDGTTPLHVASRHGYDTIVKFLVEHGSQVNLATKSGITPLLAASQLGYYTIVEFLVAHGAQVNLADKNGYTPLHVASQQGHDTIVECLVVNGSEVNLADKNGFTPLHFAISNDHLNIAIFLLENGFHINE